MPSSLPLSNVITVSLSNPAPTLGVPNMSALAIITKAVAPAGWSSGQVYAVYKTTAQVASDWGLNSDVYAMAVAVFAQVPNVLTGGGYLVVIPRLQTPSLETTQACLARTMSQIYYAGFLIDEEMYSEPTVFASLAAYCQANQKMFFYCSSQAADLNTGSILANASAAGDYYVRGLYYGTPILNGAGVQQTQIIAAAYASLLMSANFGGTDLAITMNLKELSTILPDNSLSETNWLSAQTIGVDLYANTSGVAGVVSNAFGGLFADQVYYRMWLQFQVSSNVFNVLAGTTTKIAQTEEGMDLVKDAVNQAFAQGAVFGYIAPGAWTNPDTFGDPATLVAAVAAKGYYSYSAPVASQSPSNRVARIAVPVQCAVKEAGAIHSAGIFININP